MPVNNAEDTFNYFEGFDKIVHLGLFFVLTVLIIWGQIYTAKTYQYRFIGLVKIVFITFIFGGGVELIQWKFFTYRSGDWWDLFSDMLGVSMAIFAFIVLHKKQDFKPNKTF